jgi:hypothetical protein
MAGACPAGRDWEFRDVIDIRNPESESAHRYAARQPSWAGTRTFRRGGTPLWDDGRAFLGAQSFPVRGLEGSADICLVKRVDPGVRQQVSRWRVAEAEVGITRLPDAVPAGTWAEVALVVPGAHVTAAELPVTEEMVSSTVDVNAFRVEVYQARPRRPVAEQPPR